MVSGHWMTLRRPSVSWRGVIFYPPRPAQHTAANDAGSVLLADPGHPSRADVREQPYYQTDEHEISPYEQQIDSHKDTLTAPHCGQRAIE